MGNPEHEFDENLDMPKFPGYENKAPGKDYEWRGNKFEKNKGSWFNPKTGESFHWDMNHVAGKPPHWDYSRRDGDNRGYRIFHDNSWERKIYEIGGCYYE